MNVRTIFMGLTVCHLEICPRLSGCQILQFASRNVKVWNMQGDTDVVPRLRAFQATQAFRTNLNGERTWRRLRIGSSISSLLVLRHGRRFASKAW